VARPGGTKRGREEFQRNLLVITRSSYVFACYGEGESPPRQSCTAQPRNSGEPSNTHSSFAVSCPATAQGRGAKLVTKSSGQLHRRGWWKRFRAAKSKTKPVRSQTHPHTTGSEKPKKSGLADCWPSSKHQSPRTPDSDKVIPTSFHIHVNVRSSHTHRQCLPRTLLSVFFLFPVF